MLRGPQPISCPTACPPCPSRCQCRRVPMRLVPSWTTGTSLPAATPVAGPLSAAPCAPPALCASILCACGPPGKASRRPATSPQVPALLFEPIPPTPGHSRPSLPPPPSPPAAAESSRRCSASRWPTPLRWACWASASPPPSCRAPTLVSCTGLRAQGRGTGKAAASLKPCPCRLRPAHSARWHTLLCPTHGCSHHGELHHLLRVLLCHVLRECGWVSTWEHGRPFCWVLVD